MDPKADKGASLETHRPFFGKSLKAAGTVLPIVLVFGFLHLVWIRLFVADFVTGSGSVSLEQEQEQENVERNGMLKHFPPRLDEAFDWHLSEARRKSESDIPFTEVRVITTYARPSLSARAPAIDLFVFTLGLALRDLRAEFCVLGKGNGTMGEWKMYPVNSSIDDVIMCVLPDGKHVLSEHDLVSVTLLSTHALFRALDEDLKLSSTRHAPRLEAKRDVMLLAKQGEMGVNRSGCKNTTCTLLHEWHVAIKSSVTWSSQRVEKIAPRESRLNNRYATCLAAIVKTSPHLLAPWIEYHRKLGIDHVYIFDNGLPNKARTPFEERVDVSVITWPWQKTQAQAMSYMLVTGRVRCVHIMKIDVDEYAMIGLGGHPFSQTDVRPFDRFMEAAMKESDSQHAFLRPIKMSNSGFVKRPVGVGAVPELYVHRLVEQTLENGKSICQTDVDWRAGRIHSCGFERRENGGELVEEPGMRTKGYATKIRGHYMPREVKDRGLLVHFYERSWEEWVEKWDTGTAQTVTGVFRDDRRGRLRVEQVDRKYVDVSEGNGMRVPYTFFREVFRRVVREGSESGSTCVMVREVDGYPIRKVVKINNVVQ